MFGDEGRAVGPCFVVKRNVLDHAVSERMNRRSHRSTEVQADVMVPNTTKEFGGVH